MQGLGIVTGESNVMPGPQSIHKVSPGLATGIPTNTKVNQQPLLVCLPWRTDPILVANHMWMQAFWRERTQGWEKGGQQKDLCNKQEWWLAGLFPEEDAVSFSSSAVPSQSCGALPSPSAWLIEFLEASNCLFLLDITIHLKNPRPNKEKPHPQKTPNHQTPTNPAARTFNS